MFDLAQSTIFLVTESFISGAGRVLLRVAAVLFLAYVVAMFVTLTFWSVRSATRHPGLSMVPLRPANQALLSTAPPTIQAPASPASRAA
ncbi:hypothetical protein [Ornithinimicrobium murale]|uniref:hypothetical protein n=1 Tax=Ornithinimicrobium murale TaxID=1050153 RepID=UPI0013B417DF|nr:hypothetical protein [Ornithinimicrobium murale]